MRFDQNTASKNSEKTGKQDIHLKAAQHLNMAARLHNEIAKQLATGDDQTADHHAQRAEEHLDYANEQVRLLQLRPSRCSPKNE